MTTGDWAFILIVLITVLCAMVCALAWKIAYADGHEAGRMYERNRQNQRRIRENRARKTTAVPALVSGQQPPWYTTVTARSVRTEHILSMPAPLTAPIAHPGAGRPRHVLTSTGEFQAVATASTDLFIAQMRADEEDYRKALIS